jgi:hypothetical protein
MTCVTRDQPAATSPRVSQQAIKLLHVESARGNTRVYFVAGNRALRMLGDMYTRYEALHRNLLVRSSLRFVFSYQRLHEIQFWSLCLRNLAVEGA